MKRNRIYYFVLIASTILLGLLSRQYSNYLPTYINLVLGDILWALMVYWIVGFLWLALRIEKLAILSLSICFLVEISQLCQVDWLNTIRANRLGGLILGKGFLWSDCVAYVFGIGIGCASEKLFYIRKK